MCSVGKFRTDPFAIFSSSLDEFRSDVSLSLGTDAQVNSPSQSAARRQQREEKRTKELKLFEQHVMQHVKKEHQRTEDAKQRLISKFRDRLEAEEYADDFEINPRTILMLAGSIFRDTSIPLSDRPAKLKEILQDYCRVTKAASSGDMESSTDAWDLDNLA